MALGGCRRQQEEASKALLEACAALFNCTVQPPTSAIVLFAGRVQGVFREAFLGRRSARGFVAPVSAPSFWKRLTRPLQGGLPRIALRTEPRDYGRVFAFRFALRHRGRTRCRGTYVRVANERVVHFVYFPSESPLEGRLCGGDCTKRMSRVIDHWKQRNGRREGNTRTWQD